MFFKTKHERKEKVLTVPMERTEKTFVLMSDEELISSIGKVLLFDIECYPNYFLVSFECAETEKVVFFELSPDSTIEYNKLRWIAFNFCLVGFNSYSFDIPMMWLALSGASNELLFKATLALIKDEMRREQFCKQFGIYIFQTNHIDLIEVAPLDASLKLYAGRLHADRMQELPFPPETILTREQAHSVRQYNICSDLPATRLLYEELKPYIELRESLGEEYKIDLRSKSDAQIAETLIGSEIKKINGYFPKRPVIEEGTIFKYEVPAFVKYKTYLLNEMLSIVANADFVIGESGDVIEPSEFEKLKNIRIGSSFYRMGIGGLHSNEKCMSHVADDETDLIDRDVASYYPQIILNVGLYPRHMGKGFLDVYGNFVRLRLSLKKTNKKRAGGLKIVVNGGFGKLGSPYSILYSPNLLIGVTLTGQLALLMLIESIELAGIPVVSGNTDGIVIKCPKNRSNDLDLIIKEWEAATQFETEETKYKGIYCRDVNNYFAIKEKGDESGKFLDEKIGVKVKGCFAERGSALNSVLSKNPEHLICSDAVMLLLAKNIPIEQTIMECKDIRRFITVRTVKGGAEKDGIYLGKAIRWYYAKGANGNINYVLSGNKVPKSEGAKPCMDLPLTFPDDIDYQWYINEATEILYSISYLQKPNQQISFF